MVGDVAATRHAVVAPMKSNYRRVGLGEQVRKQLAVSRAASLTSVTNYNEKPTYLKKVIRPQPPPSYFHNRLVLLSGGYLR